MYAMSEISEETKKMRRVTGHDGLTKLCFVRVFLDGVHIQYLKWMKNV